MARVVQVMEEHELQETPQEVLNQPILSTRKKVLKKAIVTRHYWAQSTTIATTDVRVPASGMKLRLKYIHYSAKGTVYAFLQYSRHPNKPDRISPAYMAANTVQNENLVTTPIEGESDEVLQLVTDAAQQIDVFVIVEEVPAEIVAEEENA